MWLRLALIVLGALVGGVVLTAVRTPERPRALHEQPEYLACASESELARMLVDGQSDSVRAALRPDLDEIRDAAAARRFRTCLSASDRVLGFLRQYEQASQASYATFPCADETLLLDRYADPGEVDWPATGPWLGAIAQIRAMKRAEGEGFRRACALLMLRARVALDLPDLNGRLPGDATACRQELDVTARYLDFEPAHMTPFLASAQQRLAAAVRSEAEAARRAAETGRYPICAETARRINDRFRLLYAQADR